MAAAGRHHRVCAPSQAKGHLSRVAPSTAQVAALGPSGLRAEDAVDFERMNAKPGRDQMLGGAFAAHAAGKVCFAAFRNPTASDRNGVQNNPGFGVSECRHRISFPSVARVGGGSRPCDTVGAAIGDTGAALTGTGAVGAPVPFTKTIFGHSSSGSGAAEKHLTAVLVEWLSQKALRGLFLSSVFNRYFLELIPRNFRDSAGNWASWHLADDVIKAVFGAAVVQPFSCIGSDASGLSLRGGVCLPAAPLAGAAVTGAPAAPLFRINTGASVKWI